MNISARAEMWVLRCFKSPRLLILVLIAAAFLKGGISPVPDIGFEAQVASSPGTFRTEFREFTWLWNSPVNKWLANLVGADRSARQFYWFSLLLLVVVLAVAVVPVLRHVAFTGYSAGLVGVLCSPLVYSQLLWLGKSDGPAILAGLALASMASPVVMATAGFVAGFNHLELAVVQFAVTALLGPRSEISHTHFRRSLVAFGLSALIGRLFLAWWNATHGIKPWSRADWAAENLAALANNILTNPVLWIWSMLGAAWYTTALWLRARRADQAERWRAAAAVLVIVGVVALVLDSTRIASLAAIPLSFRLGQFAFHDGGLEEGHQRRVLWFALLAPPLVWVNGSAIATVWPRWLSLAT